MTVPVFRSSKSKAYPLVVGSLPIKVYCHMENRNGNGECGHGGWTLVMKIDGNKVLTNRTNVMYCWNGRTVIDAITLCNYVIWKVLTGCLPSCCLALARVKLSFHDLMYCIVKFIGGTNAWVNTKKILLLTIM